MKIVVNGETREVPAAISVEGLLEHLEIPRARVAVERNEAIVPRAEHATTHLEEGDRVEIVSFVGGG